METDKLILAFDTCLDKTYVTVSDSKKYISRVILSTGTNYHHQKPSNRVKKTIIPHI